MPLKWNDHTATLSIGARQGICPGMPAGRQFRLVLVDADHGAGPEATAAADQVVDYDGSAQQVALRR